MPYEPLDEATEAAHILDLLERLRERVKGKTGLLEPTTEPAAQGGRVWRLLGVPILYSSPVVVIDGPDGRTASWFFLDL